MNRERIRIRVTGIVQGVGYRPFVHGLAARFGLSGFVENDSRGVTIEVEGSPASLVCFVSSLERDAPPAALVEEIQTEPIAAIGSDGFVILASESIEGESTPVSPDLATCPDCIRELFDPNNRRYRYPFINCTNCGPRFTIIRDIPYDRPLTTMDSFVMCPECQREYDDPFDRRFHAQPNACPVCGPRLEYQPGGLLREEALTAAKKLIADGKILAVKGIGGFHLACDATNDAAVAELRRRKGRAEKPFALLAADLEMVRLFAEAGPGEGALLESVARPIVLIKRKAGARVLSPLVAPGQDNLGFVLPYSPLHHLLVDRNPLVMTSGNRSDEPIARTNEEACDRLGNLADGFLLHNRDIHVVCDDSVVRTFAGRVLPIRRSRGYAPMPVRMPFRGAASILATGGELKATFCLTRGERAYMSQHIGDMENIETQEAFERAAGNMRSLLRIEPRLVACDLHSGYLSTRWAKGFAAQNSLPVAEVQHHHAHVAGLMAEHSIAPDERVIGVAFDGTGLGTDGAIWGGEFLIAGYADFKRAGHLRYVPLPGGDAAVKKPFRMALAHLRAAEIAWDTDLPSVRAAGSPAALALLQTQLDRGLNCSQTSSMGRLFDAAASLAGTRQSVSYEAQGAMEFESIADASAAGEYRFSCDSTGECLIFDPATVWIELIHDLRSGVPPSLISTRFHRGVAGLVASACESLRDRANLSTVALSGGVFQNVFLLSLTTDNLQRAGFRVLTHRVAPTNDAGLSLGQAVVAAAANRQVNVQPAGFGPSAWPESKP